MVAPVTRQTVALKPPPCSLGHFPGVPASLRPSLQPPRASKWKKHLQPVGEMDLSPALSHSTPAENQPTKKCNVLGCRSPFPEK